MQHVIHLSFKPLISLLNSWFGSIPRLIAAFVGMIWAYLQPTFPYALVCVMAVVIDCITAARLNRRIKRHFPNSKADGKIKSARMSKMVQDLLVVWLCILLATGVDEKLLGHFGGLHLGQYVAAIFVVCTAVSILENESSCNGAAWARLTQKIVANKVSRHIDIPEDELDRILHEHAKEKEKSASKETPET